ncbi:hypothetical protein PHYPO_G00075220 [Pangasianodon hypophthalmus]|uniref:Uncharacterized protein n=1 Tax=Pangasianodon hypophthalmus TaxID=310915 RepID=A0A5N5LV90_PANHP|nr:hypothetical protein PHYPO_G00075220 [Pangasianodon hypophthalmus]
MHTNAFRSPTDKGRPRCTNESPPSAPVSMFHYAICRRTFTNSRCRSSSPAGPVQPQRRHPLLLDDDLTPPYFFPPISLYPSPWGRGDSGP